MGPAQQLSLKESCGGTLTSPVSPCVNTDADWDELLAQSDSLVVQRSASFWTR